MAITAAVEVDVNINGGKEVKEVNDNLKTLNDVSKATAEGLNSATKSTTLMGNATGKLRESLNNASKGFSTLKNDLSAIPGPVGFVVQGFTGLQTAFKVIVSNPIGLFLTALVGSLTALYKAFTSTKAGAESMQQATAALGAIFDVFRDQLLKVVEFLKNVFTEPQQALKDFGNLLKSQIVNRVEGMLELLPALGKAIKLAFSGEFSEAGKVAGDAIGKVALGVENVTDKIGNIGKGLKGVIDEAQREAALAANIEKRLQRITDAERALSIERAKQNKIIQEAKLAYQDETLTIEQRREALEKAVKLENDLAKQELSLAKQRAAAIVERNSLSDSNAQALDEEANAQRRVFQLQQESFAKQTEVIGQIKSLNAITAADKAAADKAEEDRLKALEEQRLKDLEDEEFAHQAWIEWESEKAEARIANEEYITKRKKEEADKQAEILKAQAELEQQLFNESVALANAVIALAGEQSAIGKSVALASIAADTAMALTKALSNSQSPTPDNVATGGLAGIAKYISLATTILSNSKRAYDIIKAPAPSVSGSISTTSVPTFNAPSVRLNAGNNDFTQTNKIYVTEYDISNTQSKVRVTEGLSQF